MKARHTPWIALALASAWLAAAGTSQAQPAPNAALSTAASTAVSTDTPASAAQRPRMEKMREHAQARRQQHLADLQRQLQLQPQQEAAWSRFAQSMQPPAQAPARPDRTSWEKMTTPERIDRMQTLHAEHDVLMKQRAEATKALYAALSPEQQKTFDAHTARFMAGMQRAHQGSGMHMQGMHGAMR